MLILFFCLATVAFGRNYDAFKVVRIPTETEDERVIVQNLFAGKKFDVSYWSEPERHRNFVSVLVAPDDYSPLTKYFEENGIKIETLHSNVQE